METKLSSAPVVETSVTNNRSFENYRHLDDFSILTDLYIVQIWIRLKYRVFDSGRKEKVWNFKI